MKLRLTTHRLLVLVVISSVLLAGCAGLQATETPTAETPTATTPTESPAELEASNIAGVSNGNLTNATALVVVNGAVIVENGTTISIEQTGPEIDRDSMLTVGADGGSELSTIATASSGQSGTSDYYTNDSATYLSQGENPAVHGGSESDSDLTNHGRWLAGYSTLIHTINSL